MIPCMQFFVKYLCIVITVYDVIVKIHQTHDGKDISISLSMLTQLLLKTKEHTNKEFF